MTTEEKLLKLQEKVLGLASTLDAVTEDYFGQKPQKKDKIYRNLTEAWGKLDAALDEIHYARHKERGLEAVTVWVPSEVKAEETQEPEEDRTF